MLKLDHPKDRLRMVHRAIEAFNDGDGSLDSMREVIEEIASALYGEEVYIVERT